MPSVSTSPDSVGGPPWPGLALPAMALILLVAVELGGWNEAIFSWANGLSEITGPRFWACATLLGDGLVCAVLLLPWIRRSPRRIWGGFLGALLAVLILRVFKGTLSLPRPPAVLPPEAVTVIGRTLRRSAFPSGHTMTAFLLAGTLTLNTRRSWLPWIGAAFGTLVALSRMAVGVHWPSDVLAGAALGWVGAWLGLRWADRWGWGATPLGRRIIGILLMISALVLLLLYSSGYPSTLWFQRALAVACIVVGGRGLLREFFRPGA